MYKSLYHGRQNLKSLVFLHSVRLQKSLYSAEDAQNTGSSNFYTSVGIRADSWFRDYRDQIDDIMTLTQISVVGD